MQKNVDKEKEQKTKGGDKKLKYLSNRKVVKDLRGKEAQEGRG